MDSYKEADNFLLALQKRTCKCGANEQEVDYEIDSNEQHWFVRRCKACKEEIYRRLD